jgi:hypothetical protein
MPLDLGVAGQRQVVGVDVGRQPEADDRRVRAAVAERVGRALGDHAALRDHDDAIGELLRLVHVVGGEEDRLAELAEPLDQLPRLAARRGVEAGGRLVEEDQLGVAADPERDVEPAALAAGQRVGAGVRAVAEADEVEDLVRRARVRVGRAVELDRLAGGDLRLQALLLQNDADPLAEGPLAAPGVEPEDVQIARVGAPVALQDLHERRLPGAVRTEDREHLAAADRQVDAVERLDVAVGLAQRADGDGRRGRAGRRRRSGHFEGVREHAFRIVRAPRFVIGGRVELARQPPGGDG